MPCGGRIQKDWPEGESEDAEMNTKMEEEGNGSGNGGRRM
jgi:hypothetical protein